MELVTVQAKRRLASSKFGVSVPAGGIADAFTENECVFYVEPLQSSGIFLKIEGKDLDILGRHGRVEKVMDESSVDKITEEA